MNPSQLYIIRNTNKPDLLHHVNALQKIIQKQLPDLCVLIIHAHDQLSWVKSHIPIAINLDPFSRLPTHFPVDICRVFNSHQQSPISFQNRPGYETIDAQIHALPVGNFLLLDDDICTGGTISFINNKILALRKDINIVQSISLMHEFLAYIGLNRLNVYDIIDSHDFIGGETTSGLMIQSPSGINRHLYTAQTVNLSFRAKIPYPDQFRKDWQHHLTISS